jgi:hypothetical protein
MIMRPQRIVLKKNVMSIKLNRFDVTIGRLKVTFGMWNLSKIFLTIKCASSVRGVSIGAQKYICLVCLH